jgi:hypothetical protein
MRYIKYVSLFILLFSTFIDVRSQLDRSNHFKFQQGFEIKESVIKTSQSREVLITKHADYTFILYYTKRGLGLLEVDSFGNRRKVTVELSKDVCHLLSERSIANFAVQDSGYLTLTLWNKQVLLFQLSKGKYKYKISINSDFTPLAVKYYSQNFYLCYCYFYHPLDTKLTAWIDKVNSAGEKVKRIELSLDYPEYTYYQPTQYFDFGAEYIYYLNPAEAVVSRVDYSLNRIDQLNIPISNWTILDSSFHVRMMATMHTDFFEGFQQMDSLILGRTNRNMRLSVDENARHITINYTSPKDSLKCLVNNAFAQVDYNSDFTFKELSVFKETNCNFKPDILLNDTFPFWSTSAPTFIGNTQIFQIQYASPYFPIEGTWREFNKMKENYMKNHKPTITVWIYLKKF